MKQKPATETKLICPECSAVVVTSRPEVLIWERCPGCKSHIWDTYDMMMAERESGRHGRNGNMHAAMGLHNN